jgi:hypothetical protein
MMGEKYEESDGEEFESMVGNLQMRTEEELAHFNKENQDD